MIIVDVYVPAVDKTYNFNLNNEVTVKSVVEEISEMVEQNERTTLHGQADMLNLYDKKTGKILPKGNSLDDSGIHTGSLLILV